MATSRRKRYEYMRITTDAESSGGFAPAISDGAADVLDKLGADGWEFCSFVSCFGGREMILLKREIVDE